MDSYDDLPNDSIFFSMSASQSAKTIFEGLSTKTNFEKMCFFFQNQFLFVFVFFPGKVYVGLTNSFSKGVFFSGLEKKKQLFY